MGKGILLLLCSFLFSTAGISEMSLQLVISSDKNIYSSSDSLKISFVFTNGDTAPLTICTYLLERHLQKTFVFKDAQTELQYRFYDFVEYKVRRIEKADFIVIPAGASYTTRLLFPLRLDTLAGFAYLCDKKGLSKRRERGSTLPSGTWKILGSYENRIDELVRNVNCTDSGGKKPNPVPKIWTGRIRSNTLTIEIKR
jgi:hypothetical protein